MGQLAYLLQKMKQKFNFALKKLKVDEVLNWIYRTTNYLEELRNLSDLVMKWFTLGTFQEMSEICQ